MASCWLLCLLLHLLFSTRNNFALPSKIPPCNCIRVKDCKIFTDLLVHHEPHERDMIFNLVRNAGCGFQGLDPLACCPTGSALISRNFFQEEESDWSYELPTKHTLRARSEPWIWGRRPAPSTYKATEVPVTMRFAKFSGRSFPDESYIDLEANVLDYIDPKTHRNCPHSFYEEIETYNKFSPFRHHHFHHHTPHDFDFDSHETFHSNFGDGSDETTHNTPVLYPDDKRLKWPQMFFTTTPSSAISKVITTTPSSALSKVITTTTTTTTKQPKIAKNNTMNEVAANSPVCGIVVGTRILGGQQSTPGQFPWITRIAYLNATSNRISYRCSGSAISELYILTAAHCIVNLVEDLRLSHVRIGDGTTTATFDIAESIIHPSYDQPKYANDIAILKILRAQNGERANFGHICLPFNVTSSVISQLIGSTGIAAGWSTNSEGTETSDPVVKFLRLPIVNTTQCAITYARFSENFNDPIVITPSQLCAQGQPMNDVCRGDSGGPFMDDGTSGLINTGRLTLLGIVAFGPTTCGETSIPGVYTLVSSYMDWIVMNMRR